ncbi:MAG: galactokinase family protein, partial [Candidatus Weimeria sp.]
MVKDEVLEKVYGKDAEAAGKRFAHLADGFRGEYGSGEELSFFTAPGRTEIIGNHTDHNGGKVIAASIDLDTIGAA